LGGRLTATIYSFSVIICHLSISHLRLSFLLSFSYRDVFCFHYILYIFSASLSISIASASANFTHVPHLLYVNCGKTADWIRKPFGVVSGVGLGMGVLYFNGWNDVLIADRLVFEKLTIFPYAEYILEICVELAFLYDSQIQDRSGGW